jgi:enoyl-[acyl-carrier-protein] reductase (NADH)
MHAFTESVPLKRWVEMLDIVNLALYLAGDESSHARGSLIRVDGGETLCRYSV